MSAQQIASLKERAKFRTPTKFNKDSGDILYLCICNRQLQDILCRSCGYIFVGRQRRQCVVHPNEILLMDAVVCPKCRTNSLVEIKTSMTPVKKEQDVIMTELSHLRQRRMSGTPVNENGNACVKGDIKEDPSFSAASQLRSATTDEDWEKEIGPPVEVKPPSVAVATSPPPVSVASHGVSRPVDTSSRIATSHPQKPALKLTPAQSSKLSSTTCTAEDWEKVTGIPAVPKASSSQSTESGLANLKITSNVGAESKRVSRKVTFAPLQHTTQNCGSTRAETAQDSLAGQNGKSEVGKKMVDHEVQTEFVVQVTEEPYFLHAVSNTNVQPVIESSSSGYNYQPKMPIDSGKETSVLRAAIRRSIMQGWHREMDSINDMCAGDKRY